MWNLTTVCEPLPICFTVISNGCRIQRLGESRPCSVHRQLIEISFLFARKCISLHVVTLIIIRSSRTMEILPLRVRRRDGRNRYIWCSRTEKYLVWECSMIAESFLLLVFWAHPHGRLSFCRENSERATVAWEWWWRVDGKRVRRERSKFPCFFLPFVPVLT